MSKLFFTLSALDTWFFRDGRPFNQDDPAQFGVESLFPPLATTCVGALRAAFARAHGWIGTSETWPRQVVGDGSKLHPLKFWGPYVVSKAGALWPMPQFIVAEKDAAPYGTIARLRPDREHRCDLDDSVALPAAPDDLFGAKLLEGKFLTTEGFNAVLAGNCPVENQIQSKPDLAPMETHVGLQLKPDTRTADPGHLYSLRFVRPVDGLSIAMAVEVEEPPNEFANRLTLPAIVPFGGESRAARLKRMDKDFPSLTANGPMLRYLAILVTPADLGRDWPKPGETIPGLPGTVVSACIGKPLMAGGWFSDKKEGPQPLQPLVPAGSAWFMKAEAAEIDAAPPAHGTKIGRRRDWGFGEVAIGTWPMSATDKTPAKEMR